MTIDEPKAASRMRNLAANSPQILEFGKYLWISSDKNQNGVGFDQNDEGVVIAIASLTQILPDARGWIDFYKVVTTSGDYPKEPEIEDSKIITYSSYAWYKTDTRIEVTSGRTLNSAVFYDGDFVW